MVRAAHCCEYPRQIKKDEDKAVPVWLEIVGAWVSDDGLEDGIGQRGCVHHQSLNQELQAG